MVKQNGKSVKMEIAERDFDKMLKSNGYNPLEHFFNIAVLKQSGGQWLDGGTIDEQGVREVLRSDCRVLSISMYAQAEASQRPELVGLLVEQDARDDVKVKGIVRTPENEWRVSVQGSRGVVATITATIAQALLKSAEYEVKRVGKGAIYNLVSCNADLLPARIVSQARKAAEKPIKYYYPQQKTRHNPITGRFVGGSRGVA
jgi:hypothetical protein